MHKRLVNLDSIANHGKHWEGVDILVFESYVWWMHKPQINATLVFPTTFSLSSLKHEDTVNEKDHILISCS